MESSFSAACSLFALERILRIVQMPSSSSLDSSNSSRRVPDLLIHCGKNPLFRKLAVKMQLAVAGTFEFLKDNIVHFRTGLH